MSDEKLSRFGRALEIFKRAEIGTVPEGDAVGPDAPSVIPSARDRFERSVTPKDAYSLSMVYRAISIHAIAAKQMGLYETVTNMATDETTRVPTCSLLRKPDVNDTRPAFIEMTVVSLASTGNAYWRKRWSGSGPTAEILSVEVMNPHEVTPTRDPDTGAVTFQVGGKTLTARDVQHLKLLRVPGEAKGLGPIQAAQSELRGALDVRDYSSNWFDSTPTPGGVLSTDQPLTREAAALNKKAFKESMGGTRDVAMIGNGLKYASIFLSPADALWLEAQQFDTTRIARLFGTPSSLMLATVEGNTQNYQNVEQDWLGFVRFSNMQYLIEIEEAFGALLPYGHNAKFNVEALLRSDTSTRYKNHESALRAKWMLKSEVRKIEGLDAIEGIDDIVDVPVAPVETNEVEPANG